jgi:sensor histidine kinase regulating citrate/malate metabolism
MIRFRLLLEGGNDRAMSGGVFLIIIVVVLLFILMVIRESESDYFQKKNTISEYYLETQKRHYESLMESNRQIRKIKHDMKNHIYCLQGLYQNRQYEELGAYLEQISDHLEQIDTSVHVGNEIADAILSEKMARAKQLGILLEVDGEMSGAKMSALDICTIFSNMIDNAMEAVQKLRKEDRNIRLDIRKNHNFLLITERNPVAHKLEIHDNRIATTKKEKGNHGFGIINMIESVEKYNGECQLNVMEDENGHYEFQIEIMIPLAGLSLG